MELFIVQENEHYVSFWHYRKCLLLRACETYQRAYREPLLVEGLKPLNFKVYPHETPMFITKETAY